MLAISNYISHTITVPELLWTVFTGIGLGFNISLFLEANQDLRTLRRANINSIREYASISNIISEGLRTFTQFTFFILGIVAMLVPNDHTRIPTFQWVLTITFILLATILAGSSALDRIRRKRLMDLIQKYEGGF